MNLGIEAKADGRNPFTRICYICGREYGSSSIAIHEKKCLEKFDKEQALLPKSKRRVLIKPQLQDLPINGGNQADAMNDAAYAAYMEQGREECQNCGRKFAPGRLEVHLKSCKEGGYFAKKKALQDGKVKL